MAFNEPPTCVQTTLEALVSPEYIRGVQISKVVWNIVPAWFPSVPTMVSRDGLAQHFTLKFCEDDHDLSSTCTRSGYHDHAPARYYQRNELSRGASSVCFHSFDYIHVFSMQIVATFRSWWRPIARVDRRFSRVLQDEWYYLCTEGRST